MSSGYFDQVHQPHKSTSMGLEIGQFIRRIQNKNWFLTERRVSFFNRLIVMKLSAARVKRAFRMNVAEVLLV